MGADYHYDILDAERQKAQRVYEHLRRALKLKRRVEKLCYEGLDSAEAAETDEFFDALDEAEKALDAPLFS